MAKRKFTVVWGNIGDDPGKRVDHVFCEPTFADIMDAAFQLVYNEWTADESVVDWSELRYETPYDGYAIIDGHKTDSRFASF